MEKKITLQTADNHTIYGTLNQSRVGQSKLLIFVHGLTGNQNEHQFFNAAPFFTKKDFDVFRFDLYSGEDNARQLSECSIKTHSADLEVVVDHFKKLYQKIFLVGHSLGAPTIINADLSSVSKIVLWDPTRGMNSLEEKDCEYDEKIGKYILHWGVEALISQEMIDDWKEAANLETLAKKISKPCKFIFAGDCENRKPWLPCMDLIKPSHEHVIIKGATHVFLEEGKERELFEETLKWIED